MMFIGSRWNDLVQALGSQEVLLINNFTEQYWKDGEFSVPRLPDIEFGTGEAYRESKERLLSPQSGLKNTCLQLSGISHMILASRKLDDDCQVRKFIVSEINRRVQEVLGKPDLEVSEEDEHEEDDDEFDETVMDCT
jgi:hypothetical protein